VKIEMLLKIRTLREAFRTSCYSTGKGLLLCVDSEVVEEVTSFSEELSTILVSTLHDSSYSLSVLMFVPKNLIIDSIRYVL